MQAVQLQMLLGCPSRAFVDCLDENRDEKDLDFRLERARPALATLTRDFGIVATVPAVKVSDSQVERGSRVPTQAHGLATVVTQPVVKVSCSHFPFDQEEEGTICCS